MVVNRIMINNDKSILEALLRLGMRQRQTFLPLTFSVTPEVSASTII